MTLTNDPLEQEYVHAAARWRELQCSFERLQEAYLQTTRSVQERCHQLHQQAESIERDRLSYEQEREHLWSDRLAAWEGQGGCAYQSNHLRERMQVHQDFSKSLLHSRESFVALTQAVRERLAVLRDQRAFLMALSDHEQQQEGYRQIQAAYLELQQELRDYRQLLREQAAGHSQQRLAYQTQQGQLRARTHGRWCREEP